MNIGSRMTVGVLPSVEPYIEVPASNAGYYVFSPSSITGMKGLWTIDTLGRPFNNPDGRGFRFEFKVALLTTTDKTCPLFGAMWTATDSTYSGYTNRTIYPGMAIALLRDSGGLGEFRMFYGTETARAATQYNARWDSGSVVTNMSTHYNTERFAPVLAAFTTDQPKTVVVDIATNYLEDSLQTGSFPSLSVLGRPAAQKKALWSSLPYYQKELGLSLVEVPNYLMAYWNVSKMEQGLPAGSRLYSFKATRTKPFATSFTPADDLTESDEVIWDFVPASNGRLYDRVSQSYVSPTGGTLTTVGTTLY